jgi:hypothetical protein
MDDYSKYLKLKANYEASLLEKKRNKCAFCKREVGMKFIQNKNSYKAMCGDKNPCKTLEFTIPTHINSSYIQEKNDIELNDIIGQIKLLRLKMLYYEEIEKEDIELFEQLKKRFVELKLENDSLKEHEDNFQVPEVDTLRQELKDIGEFKNKSKDERLQALQKQQLLLTAYQEHKPSVFSIDNYEKDEPRRKIEYTKKGEILKITELTPPIIVHKNQIETEIITQE